MKIFSRHIFTHCSSYIVPVPASIQWQGEKRAHIQHFITLRRSSSTLYSDAGGMGRVRGDFIETIKKYGKLSFFFGKQVVKVKRMESTLWVGERKRSEIKLNIKFFNIMSCSSHSSPQAAQIADFTLSRPTEPKKVQRYFFCMSSFTLYRGNLIHFSFAYE